MRILDADIALRRSGESSSRLERHELRLRRPAEVRLSSSGFEPKGTTFLPLSLDSFAVSLFFLACTMVRDQVCIENAGRAIRCMAVCHQTPRLRMHCLRFSIAKGQCRAMRAYLTSGKTMKSPRNVIQGGQDTWPFTARRELRYRAS
ncbi:hypothetical protein B0H12DRAFT_1125384 [Mycena haematopus]|nr:hypothetical protein B0H12DRAFT_1125384 [Mycena haematopus]